MSQCPSSAQLQQLLEEQMLTAERVDLLAHIDHCPSCLETLERLSADDFSWLIDSGGSRAEDDSLTAALAARGTSALPAIPDFAIERVIGRGGHGIVFRAWQQSLRRPVALKLLRKGAFATADEVNRFLAEAESAARLRHPGIVQVHALGNTDGVPWLAMELLEGGRLSDRTGGNPVSGRMAARLVERLARAVAHAHQNHVIHRDLKPGNILFAGPAREAASPDEAAGWDNDEEVKIADFGLSKQLDSDEGQTPTMAILGTPSYMAPEQALGETRGALSATDIYSLGAILYELLTGRPPFRGESPYETIMQVRTDEPVAPRLLHPRISADLEVICLKCLEKKPERRYETADALADDLHSFLEGRPVLARPPGFFERSIRWCWRNPWGAAAAVLGTASVLVGLGFSWYSKQRHEIGRAVALVQSLGEMDERGLPDLLRRIEELQGHADPLLQQVVTDSSSNPSQQLRAVLALVPRHPELADLLYQQIDAASEGELLLIQRALAPFSERLVPSLDDEIDRLAPPGTVERMRKACLLATMAPQDDRWLQLGPEVAAFVVRQNPLVVRDWQEAFAPVRSLLLPHLIASHHSPSVSEPERLMAATVLSQYIDADATAISGLVEESDAQQFAVHLRNLRRVSATAKSLLQVTMNQTSAVHADDSARDDLARRRSRAAVALIHLGEDEPLETMLAKVDLREQSRRDFAADLPELPETGLDDEPRATSYLIHDLARYEVPVQRVIDVWRRCERPDVRYALILALGEYSERQFPQGARQALLPELWKAYWRDPDPGVHGALTWLLGVAWKLDDEVADADRALRRDLPEPGFQWFVDPSGRTFTVFRGPYQTLLGSPPDERYRSDGEELRRVNIDYDYAIATREETAADFAEARRAIPEVFNQFTKGRLMPFRDPLEPARNVGWFQGYIYCRWLSDQYGLVQPDDTHCAYLPLARLAEYTHMEAGFLTMPGYRLPTHVEWEHAARAGARTARFYGFDRKLMHEYSWTLHNSDDEPQRVGTRKPNAYGLFDVVGNVWEQTMHSPLQERNGVQWAVDHGFSQPLDQIVRGGSYLYHAAFCRSSARYSVFTESADYTIGIRIARSIPRSSDTSAEDAAQP